MAGANTAPVVAAVLSGLAVVLVSVAATLAYRWHWRARRPPRTLRDPTASCPLRLIDKLALSPDTVRLRFALPSPDHVLGLPTGQHVCLTARIDGEVVVRPYTPVTSDDDAGHMDLVVKVYRRGAHPQFPDGGRMSRHLDGLPLGDIVHVRGPIGLLTYPAPGTFHIRPDRHSPAVPVRASRIGLVAGGTGITPMLQLIRRVLADPRDGCRLWLLFANQTEADILLRDELDRLAAAHADRLRVWYTLDRPTADWRYGHGFVSAAMMAQHLPPPGDDTVVLVCGPPAMVSLACRPNLDKLGYPARSRFTY